jgi:hypothetical protein
MVNGIEWHSVTVRTNKTPIKPAHLFQFSPVVSDGHRAEFRAAKSSIIILTWQFDRIPNNPLSWED